MKSVFAAATVLLPALSHAAITIDGTVDGDYGAPIAVQTVDTAFGNSTGGNGGGELDAAFARVEGGRLFVTITGNIEPNFNQLSLFIDSKAGGENTLSSLDYDAAARLGGMTFDSGITIDYHLFARWGGNEFYVDIVDRMGGSGINSAGGTSTVGAGTTVQSGSFTGGPLTGVLDWGFNNNNNAGVQAGSGAADQAAAAAVTTGFELAIDLSDLGYTGGDLNLVAAYGGMGHDYFSNQFLGGFAAPQGNLGGDGNGNFTGNSSGINLNNFAGDQYFTVAVPEPSVTLLGGLAILGLISRRSRS